MLRFLGTKIGISLFLAILIIGGAVVLRYQQPKADQDNSIASVIVENVIERSLERDDDEDGLLNWEEALYKTDPLKADTDSDGVSDKAEVDAETNPLAVGTTSLSTASSSATTPTDRLSQELFRQYLSLKSSGSEITPELSNRIAELVLAQDYSDERPSYAASSIRTSSDTSALAIKKYGNLLGRALSAEPAGDMTELQIFQRLSSEPVASYTEELKALRARYEAMKNDILKVTAPKGFESAQADIANAIVFFIEAIDGGLSMDTDPIGAITKIGRYQYGLDTLESAGLEMRNLFKANKVAFSSSEDGYVFME